MREDLEIYFYKINLLLLVITPLISSRMDYSHKQKLMINFMSKEMKISFIADVAPKIIYGCHLLKKLGQNVTKATKIWTEEDQQIVLETSLELQLSFTKSKMISRIMADGWLAKELKRQFNMDSSWQLLPTLKITMEIKKNLKKITLTQC